MADFATAYAPLAGFEGGWCNVQGDSGGETYAGIARRYWPDWPGWKLIDREKDHSSFASGASAFTRHLAAVPGLADMVSGWYRSEWWDRLGLAALPQDLANEIFEQSVSHPTRVRGLKPRCFGRRWPRPPGRTPRGCMD